MEKQVHEDEEFARTLAALDDEPRAKKVTKMEVSLYVCVCVLLFLTLFVGLVLGSHKHRRKLILSKELLPLACCREHQQPGHVPSQEQHLGGRDLAVPEEEPRPRQSQLQAGPNEEERGGAQEQSGIAHKNEDLTQKGIGHLARYREKVHAEDWNRGQSRERFAQEATGEQQQSSDRSGEFTV